jgi:hypothetical protein
MTSSVKFSDFIIKALFSNVDTNIDSPYFKMDDFLRKKIIPHAFPETRYLHFIPFFPLTVPDATKPFSLLPKDKVLEMKLGFNRPQLWLRQISSKFAGADFSYMEISNNSNFINMPGRFLIAITVPQNFEVATANILSLIERYTGSLNTEFPELDDFLKWKIIPDSFDREFSKDLETFKQFNEDKTPFMFDITSETEVVIVRKLPVQFRVFSGDLNHKKEVLQMEPTKGKVYITNCQRGVDGVEGKNIDFEDDGKTIPELLKSSSLPLILSDSQFKKADFKRTLSFVRKGGSIISDPDIEQEALNYLLDILDNSDNLNVKYLEFASTDFERIEDGVKISYMIVTANIQTIKSIFVNNACIRVKLNGNLVKENFSHKTFIYPLIDVSAYLGMPDRYFFIGRISIVGLNGLMLLLYDKLTDIYFSECLVIT